MVVKRKEKRNHTDCIPNARLNIKSKAKHTRIKYSGQVLTIPAIMRFPCSICLLEKVNSEKRMRYLYLDPASYMYNEHYLVYMYLKYMYIERL